jgi:anaerobic dimethyl sulfoxide reductase subunit B (iron-sulfur subunit)
MKRTKYLRETEPKTIQTMTTFAFTFDARACSGCKACQEACKDKNRLPLGVLWRQVIEVSGGKWQKTGPGKTAAWENSVFAYNLSLACNHCVHPKCAGVCPTDAYSVRPDGIVLLDSSRCMGCGYCAWACPYGAPQYNPGQGVMTKCNFCYDSLDAGLPPSCVAACPLRVLDYGAVEEMSTLRGNQNLWQLPASEHPFPLPDYSHTEPHLAIKPHPGMSTPLEKKVANREEIQPPRGPEHILEFAAIEELPGSDELPLVAFTLLTQMAVGLAICVLALSSIPLPVLLAIGGLLGAGGLISFLHLGRKRNAWRAVTHLRKSWLSREVLMAGLFGAAWVLTVGLVWLQKASFAPWLMAVLGLALIYCMARVYFLRAVPAWNTWRTPAAFFLSAAVLGTLGIRLAMPGPHWAAIAGLGLAAEMGMMPTDQPSMGGMAGRLRVALLGLGIFGALLIAILPLGIAGVLAIPVLLIALAEEAIGRWQFYAGRAPSPF